MKGKSKIIYALTVLTVYLFTVVLVTIGINVLLHYIVMAFGNLSLFASTKGTAKAIDYSFKPGYLSSPAFVKWYLPAAIACVIVAVYIKELVFKTSRRILSLIPNIAPDMEGSSRWAKKREMKQGLTRINKKEIQLAQQTGVILASDWRHYYVDTETVNSFFIGTTRSGKSQIEALMTIWLISKCQQKQSFIAFDMKAELLEYSYADLKNVYEIYALNFQDPSQSSRYNPLAIIIAVYLKEVQCDDGDYSTTVEMTTELAHVITHNAKSDPVWPQSAQSLLVAMILFLIEDGYKRNCLDKVNLFSVYNFFIELGSCEIHVGKQSINALDALLSALPIGHPAKMAYATSKFAIGDMRSSIFATLASNLQLFADSGIARMTSGNDIDFMKLVNPEKPCAIFLVVPDNKKSRYMLASLFVNQCYAQLLEYSHNYSRGMLPQRVRFILDELGNMPSIPDLSTKVTTGLGHNILFDLYVQSMAQLEEKYGRLDAATIQGNCGNWMYINSLDKDTNHYISDQLGNSTTEYKTYSGESGQILDRSQMSHYKSRPLMTHDELPRMKKGEVVAIRQRCYPIHTKLPFFYKMKRPVTPIKNIKLQENRIPLRDILYPIDEIKKAVIAQVTKKEPAKAGKAVPASDSEHINQVWTQSVINNLNILTQAAFGRALGDGDLKSASEMVETYHERHQLTDEQVELITRHINSMK